MPLMFSWTESFRRSYFLKTRRKIGITVRMMTARPRPRIGITATKIQAMRPPMMKAVVKEKISIAGARKPSRISIM